MNYKVVIPAAAHGAWLDSFRVRPDQCTPKGEDGMPRPIEKLSEGEKKGAEAAAEKATAKADEETVARYIADAIRERLQATAARLDGKGKHDDAAAVRKAAGQLTVEVSRLA